MNLKKMAQDLGRYQLHFDDPTTKWLEMFIRNEGRVEQQAPKWILPLLKPQPDIPAQDESSNLEIQEKLIHLVEKEERKVEVITFLCKPIFIFLTRLFTNYCLPIDKIVLSR